MFSIGDITAITVSCNTKDLLMKSYTSFRLHHPDIPMVIIDGSARNNPCFLYSSSLKSDKTQVINYGKNIGHGLGMDYGIEQIKTPLTVIFDTDVIIKKSPLLQMVQLMDDSTFGVGWITEIGKDGYDFGTFKHHKNPIKYLHPYFHLINISQYKKYYPYVHHGAPCYKTMVDIYNRGLSDRVLISFSGLTGHTSGRGINWVGKPSDYVQHDFGGTRTAMKKLGKLEIEGKWEL